MPYDIKDHVFAVCAYKESPYLEECVRSVLDQTVKSRVVLCTSTPNSHISEIARKYGLPLLENKAGGNMAADFNFALKGTGARIVTLCHQDDLYEPNYLEELEFEVVGVKKPLIFFSDYYEIRGGEKASSGVLLAVKRMMLFPLRVRALQSSRFIRRSILSLGCPICCPSVTYFLDNLPFASIFQPGFRSNLDWQAWERLSQVKGGFVYHSKALMRHRIHVDSETSACISDNVSLGEDYEMFHKFWPEPLARVIAGFYLKKRSESNRN